MKEGNYEKTKNILYNLSNKNEIINKEDLKIKVLSLTRLVKVKENNIELLNNLLIKKVLKNLFLKKYLKENKSLLNAFIYLKYYKKKKYLQSKLFYEHETFLTILKNKNNNLIDIGVGEYNSNLRLFIRRQICLTLLKKRKRNINNKCDSYIEKSFYSNNNYIDENKNKFTNISLENNVNNFFIQSINKENMILVFSILKLSVIKIIIYLNRIN